MSDSLDAKIQHQFSLFRLKARKDVYFVADYVHIEKHVVHHGGCMPHRIVVRHSRSYTFLVHYKYFIKLSEVKLLSSGGSVYLVVPNLYLKMPVTIVKAEDDLYCDKGFKYCKRPERDVINEFVSISEDNGLSKLACVYGVAAKRLSFDFSAFIKKRKLLNKYNGVSVKFLSDNVEDNVACVN